MTVAETKTLRWFLGGLGLIALWINGYFIESARSYRQVSSAPSTVEVYHPAPVPLESLSKPINPPSETIIVASGPSPIEVYEREAAARAARIHQEHVAQYINSGIPRTPGKRMISVAVATEGAPNRTLAATITEHLKTDQIAFSPSLFKPSFVQDGLLLKAMSGSTETLNDLDLTNAVDGVVLANETVEYTTDRSLENLETATVHLDVSSIPLPNSDASQTWTYDATGAGFTRPAAKKAAEERLAKLISKDPKFSLSPSP